MGKAAHVGVGRLFSLDNLDGVQGRGCMNNAREMDMPQYEFEVLERIEAGEPAWVILDDALPTARSRFRRLTNSLIKLMDDIQEEFPDASLYTGSGGFNLLLGSSHNAQTNQPQQDLVAESANARLVVGDGDW